MSRGSDIFERQSYPAGSMILREGDPGYSAYLIQSGRVNIFSSNDKHKVSLARLGAGEIFGEMALLSDEPRVASVEAVENCNLIVITREVFKKKLGDSDPTVQGMLKMLAGRVIESNNTVIHSINSIRDLEETIRIKFNNILENMPEEQKREFRDAILPQINALLEALHSFRDNNELTESSSDTQS